MGGKGLSLDTAPKEGGAVEGNPLWGRGLMVGGDSERARPLIGQNFGRAGTVTGCDLGGGYSCEAETYGWIKQRGGGA